MIATLKLKRKKLKEQHITPDNIKIFVVQFYTRIIKDSTVGPFFTEILGQDINNKQWQEHIELLCDFWATMTLGKKDYTGSPFAPHARMTGLRKETFEQWINLLHITVDDIYEEKIGNTYKEIGHIISRNFMRNLGIHS